MKFAFSTRILRLLPLLEAVDVIAKAGFCAVELMADRPHAFPDDLTAEKISALNQSLNERKLKVTSLNACVVTTLGEAHNPSWLEEDWQKRERRIRYTLDCMRLAAALGIGKVTTQPGGPIPANTIRGDSWRLFVANMHRVVPLARRLGVKLLLEPAPDMLIETSDHMLELLKEVDASDELAVSFDLVHCYCAGEDPLAAWEKLQPHVALVRIADAPENTVHSHLQLGEGVLDIRSFLEAVEKSGYQGYVVIQPDGYEQSAGKIVYGAASYLQEAGFMARKIDYCQLGDE
jgi:fructoselysine 3-epimerase